MSDPIERIIKALKKVEQNSALVPQENITIQVINAVDGKFHDHVIAAELGTNTTPDHANRERLRIAGWSCDGDDLVTTKGHIGLGWLAGKNRKEIKKLLKSKEVDFTKI